MTVFKVDPVTLVFFCAAVGLVLLTGIVIRAVKREDPDLWSQLGSPSLLNVDANASIYKFWHWVFFPALRAKALSSRTSILRLILKFGTLVYVVAFCAMIVRVFLP
jgi:hypothetical protein